jgi:signal peptidase II
MSVAERRSPHLDALLVGVAAVALAADQLTKAWALRHLADGPRHVVWTLQLDLAHNTGAAFSLFSGSGAGPVIASLALIVVAVVAVRSRTLRSSLGMVAAGMVLGGALGNLADRAFRSNAGFLQGAVVDWIDLRWWPVFNVADSFVSVGVILLVVVLWRQQQV